MLDGAEAHLAAVWFDEETVKTSGHGMAHNDTHSEMWPYNESLWKNFVQSVGSMQCEKLGHRVFFKASVACTATGQHQL